MTRSDPGAVLVIGGEGGLGGAIVRAALRDGWQVQALVHALDEVAWPEHDQLTLVEGGPDDDLVDELVAEAPVVVLVALPAPGDDPLAALDRVLLGGRHSLLACLGHQRPVVLVQVVQPEGLGVPAAVRTTLDRYAAHLATEGLRVVTLTCRGLYGPELRADVEGGELTALFDALPGGGPLRLPHDAAAQRTPCFAEDAADAVITALRALRSDTLPIGARYEVHGPTPAGLDHAAEVLTALAACRNDVQVRPVPAWEAPAAAATLPGWQPRTALVDGLRATLASMGLLQTELAPPEPIPVIRPCYEVDERLLAAFRTALDLGQTTNAGVHVRGLEADFSAWLGVPDVLSTRSGAASLDLIALALPRRGKVLLPAFTYIATLNAFERAGFEPLLADVDPHSWTLCPEHTEALLERHGDVTAIVPVNVFGVPPDLDRLVPLARRSGAALIYDNAHGLGTLVDGRRYDPRPDATAYSLHATKLLPSIEGGLLVCPDDRLRAAVLRLRTHGIFPDPLDAVPGFNAKLDELSAATARHGLAGFAGVLERRHAYGDQLVARLQATGRWQPQRVPAGVRTNHQNLCLRTPGGVDRTAAVFAAHRVGIRRYFDPPLHTLRRLAGTAHLPQTDALCAELVCLPMHSRMTDEQLDRIVAAATEAAR
jgi:dTDP-4-amino-4,6-dideoxygalactose transaminase/nucleoside-diphosphate-sugar epimerase